MNETNVLVFIYIQQICVEQLPVLQFFFTAAGLVVQQKILVNQGMKVSRGIKVIRGIKVTRDEHQT